MRKFIISDLHGNGNIYDSIMGFLDNINKDEEVILYINGDLIDRGEDSGRLLLDIYDRIVNKKGFKIEYLAGNHELMMYQASLRIKNGKWPKFSNWFYNGGIITANYLDSHLDTKMKSNIISFISNLKLYHKFKEILDGKKIVLVHAMCPRVVNDICDTKISDNNIFINDILWVRKEDNHFFRRKSLGNKEYFTIIGHTPVNSIYGYEYDYKENVLNIDGGCYANAIGYKEYNHVPLIEICDNKLRILTFNNNNSIIYGNYFCNGKSTPINESELETYRKYLIDNKFRKKRILK